MLLNLLMVLLQPDGEWRVERAACGVGVVSRCMQSVVLVLSCYVFMVFSNTAMPVCAPEVKSEIELIIAYFNTGTTLPFFLGPPD